MRHTGKMAYYTPEEIAEFFPLWERLAAREGFATQTLRIREILLLADEESIMNGSSPFVPALKRYEQEVQNFINAQNLEWSHEKQRIFIFYCLYHEGRDLEFDVAAAVRRAQNNAANSGNT